METSIITQIISFILHIDMHLHTLLAEYGSLVYFILFMIVFCETGLVFMPFLPGDSLLFATGAIAACGGIQYSIVVPLLLGAAVLGDAVNYKIGAWVGPEIFNRNSRFLKRQHLLSAHAFYEKYGGRAVVLARFMPIIRTVVPFVAGIANMQATKFLLYNIIGAIVWVVGLVSMGYFFGGLPIIKKNFSCVILGIIFVSMLPLIIETMRVIVRKKRSTSDIGL